MKDKLIIFDTTLRDGEQSPGAAMTKEEKLRIARQLEKLGVDVIEAGFAAASPGDFDAVKSIAETIKNSTVCSLARASENDVRRAGEAEHHLDDPCPLFRVRRQLDGGAHDFGHEVFARRAGEVLELQPGFFRRFAKQWGLSTTSRHERKKDRCRKDCFSDHDFLSSVCRSRSMLAANCVWPNSRARLSA